VGSDIVEVGTDRSLSVQLRASRIGKLVAKTGYTARYFGGELATAVRSGNVGSILWRNRHVLLEIAKYVAAG
jgi:hypothetical protein